MPYGTACESNGRVITLPTLDPQHTEHTEPSGPSGHPGHSGHEEPPVTAEDLLEEVSIDGMCGVY
jgi:mycofactocin precursor